MSVGLAWKSIKNMQYFSYLGCPVVCAIDEKLHSFINAWRVPEDCLKIAWQIVPEIDHKIDHKIDLVVVLKIVPNHLFPFLVKELISLILLKMDVKFI